MPPSLYQYLVTQYFLVFKSQPRLAIEYLNKWIVHRNIYNRIPEIIWQYRFNRYTLYTHVQCLSISTCTRCFSISSLTNIFYIKISPTVKLICITFIGKIPFKLPLFHHKTSNTKVSSIAKGEHFPFPFKAISIMHSKSHSIIIIAQLLHIQYKK